MAHPYWPLFDLRLRTERLELRPPDDHDLIALARLAAAGVHDPDFMPFTVPWTRNPSPQLEVEAFQWWWRQRADLKPDGWSISFAVLLDGEHVGIQDVAAKQFPIRRSVETGSWLGRAHQGKGIGKQMRAAVLALAFDGLGAVLAATAAFADNGPSLGVTRALGYEDDGWQVDAREGAPVVHRRFRMTAQQWRSAERPAVTIEHLEPCLPLLGLGQDDDNAERIRAATDAISSSSA